jgi:hypothetical protein
VLTLLLRLQSSKVSCLISLLLLLLLLSRRS